MNINHWKGFLLVAKTRNITKSAAQMHLTQQALSRILDQLEEELGTTLFIRIQGGTGLTEIGRKILPIAETLVETNEKCLTMIQEVIDNSGIDLRIAFENSVLLNGYPPELLSRVGDFTVSAYLAYDNATCIQDVVTEKADCAFLMKPPQLNGLSYYPISRRRPPVIMSRNHYLASRKELHIEDLKDVNHSWLSIHSASFDLYYKACMKRGFFPRITSEYPTAELQHRMLSEGQEITIGGGFIYTENEPNLVRIPLICDDFWVESGFVYNEKHKDRLNLDSYFFVAKQFFHEE